MEALLEIDDHERFYSDYNLIDSNRFYTNFSNKNQQGN